MINLIKIYGNNLLSKILPQGIAFLIAIILTRKLGIEEYGNFVAVIILCQLIYFSITGAFITNYLREDDSNKISLNDNTILILKVGLILYIPFIICAYNGQISLTTATFIWLTHILIQQNNLNAVYFRKNKKDNLILLIQTVPYIFLITVLLLLRNHLTLRLVSATYFASWFIPHIFFSLLNTIPNIKIGSWKIKTTRQTAIFFGTKVLIINTIFTQINSNFDQILLNFLVDSYSLGIYRICFVFANLAMPVIGVLSFIYLSNLQSKNLDIIQRLKVQLYINFSILICFIIFTFFTAELILNRIYHIYDERATNALKILPIGILLNGLSQVISYTLLFLKRDTIVLIALIISTIFNIICNLMLVPKFGIIGCAWVAVLTQLLNCIILCLYFAKIRAQVMLTPKMHFSQ